MNDIGDYPEPGPILLRYDVQDCIVKAEGNHRVQIHEDVVMAGSDTDGSPSTAVVRSVPDRSPLETAGVAAHGALGKRRRR